VTGGSTGIGLATARRLARKRCPVVITGRRQAVLDVAESEIGHGEAAIPGDISVAADLERVVKTVAAAHRRIEILFANGNGGEFVPLGEITEAQFDKYVGINMKGKLFTVQSALPIMLAGSPLVITGSTASIQGTPAFGIYAATEVTSRSFARTWARI
jgi:NAD(P)-dependent dehydrogenase (short-subunit alcohol dehydrogenase family)